MTIEYLHKLATEGNEGELEKQFEQLKARIDINARVKPHDRTLLMAVIIGDEKENCCYDKIAISLIAMGADLNIKDANGKTALDHIVDKIAKQPEKALTIITEFLPRLPLVDVWSTMPLLSAALTALNNHEKSKNLDKTKLIKKLVEMQIKQAVINHIFPNSWELCKLLASLDPKERITFDLPKILRIFVLHEKSPIADLIALFPQQSKADEKTGAQTDIKSVGPGVPSHDIINAKDENGDTALHIAAQNGCTEHIKILLQNGGDPKIPNKLGQTSLMLAACHRHLAAVNVLLEKSDAAIVNMSDENGLTALHHVLNCDPSVANEIIKPIVEVLINAGSNPTKAAKNIVVYESGVATQIRTAEEKHPSFKGKINIRIQHDHAAWLDFSRAQWGDRDASLQSMSLGKTPSYQPKTDQKEITALAMAHNRIAAQTAELTHRELVMPKQQFFRLICAKAMFDYLDDRAKFFEHKDNLQNVEFEWITPNGETLLFFILKNLFEHQKSAVPTVYTDIHHKYFKDWFSFDDDPNTRAAKTCLHAAKLGYSHTVRLLKQMNPTHLNFSLDDDKRHTTPLMHAAQFCDLRTIFKDGADVKSAPAPAAPPNSAAADVKSTSAPSTATLMSTNAAAAIVANKQIELELKNTDDETALLVAVKARKYTNARCLIELGADVDITDKNSDTIFDRLAQNFFTNNPNTDDGNLIEYLCNTLKQQPNAKIQLNKVLYRLLLNAISKLSEVRDYACYRENDFNNIDFFLDIILKQNTFDVLLTPDNKGNLPLHLLVAQAPKDNERGKQLGAKFNALINKMLSIAGYTQLTATNAEKFTPRGHYHDCLNGNPRGFSSYLFLGARIRRDFSDDYPLTPILSQSTEPTLTDYACYMCQYDVIDKNKAEDFRDRITAYGTIIAAINETNTDDAKLHNLIDSHANATDKFGRSKRHTNILHGLLKLPVAKADVKDAKNTAANAGLKTKLQQQLKTLREFLKANPDIAKKIESNKATMEKFLELNTTVGETNSTLVDAKAAGAAAVLPVPSAPGSLDPARINTNLIPSKQSDIKETIAITVKFHIYNYEHTKPYVLTVPKGTTWGGVKDIIHSKIELKPHVQHLYCNQRQQMDQREADQDTEIRVVARIGDGGAMMRMLITKHLPELLINSTDAVVAVRPAVLPAPCAPAQADVLRGEGEVDHHLLTDAKSAAIVPGPAASAPEKGKSLDELLRELFNLYNVSNVAELLVAEGFESANFDPANKDDMQKRINKIIGEQQLAARVQAIPAPPVATPGLAVAAMVAGAGGNGPPVAFAVPQLPVVAPPAPAAASAKQKLVV